MKKVILKPTKEKSLLKKHPWLFSRAIKKIDEKIVDGDIVKFSPIKINILLQDTTLMQI